MINPFLFLFRARDKPRDAVSAATTFSFGTSGSGKPVNAKTAIQVSTVYACVRVIAETVASLPFPPGYPDEPDHVVPDDNVPSGTPVSQLQKRLALIMPIEAKNKEKAIGRKCGSDKNSTARRYCSGDLFV